ncbi:HEAT repeat domain-containing protein [Henriciella litoralis]|uniref:HEAT repeat domain-containing protein n=1 Tax=Henriciella litoralis TaxID=568102 RepID=UPI00146CD7E5|nr:HEAT repeat domain-containing protein [Henriciella litoralis]
MAAISIAAFLLLVVHRYLSRKAKTRGERIHNETIDALLVANEDHDEAVRKLTPMIRSRATFTQTFLEYTSLVRGSDLQHAVDALLDAGAEAEIIKSLHGGNNKYRRVAAETLGFFDTDTVKVALFNVLESKAPTPVKVAATRSLLALGQKPDLADILPRFDLRELEAPLEMAAIFQFFARDNPEPLIRRVGMGVDDDGLQSMMIEALGRCDVYDAIPVLEARTQNKSARVRAAAIEALGRLGLPIASTIIEAALRDENSEVRAEAAEAVGNVVMPEYAHKLETLLSDVDWNVRFRAAAAMLELGADSRLLLEAAALQNPSQRAQQTASLVLSERAAA